MNQERFQWLLTLIRDDKLVRFYQWIEWRKLRLKALERDNFECQQCKRKGKYKKAQNVHHIKEVKLFPLLAMELENLESICITCHNDEHKRLESKQQPRFTNEERW